MSWFDFWKTREYKSSQDFIDLLPFTKFYPAVRYALLVLLTLPATTCTVERSFSTFVGILRLERRSISLAGPHVAKEANPGRTGTVTLAAVECSGVDHIFLHRLFPGALLARKPGTFFYSCPPSGSILRHDLPTVWVNLEVLHVSFADIRKSQYWTSSRSLSRS